MLFTVNCAQNLKDCIIEEIQEPRQASVKFQTKDIRSRMSIFGMSEDKKRRIRGEQSKNVIADAWLEPIRNPVTGKAHRAIIEIPEGFESSRMDQASMKTLVANDGNLRFQYEGTYGSFSENTWKGP